MKVTPRPYQRMATTAALKGLRGRSKRALVVLATGLGKTFTAAFITKAFRAKRVLFLVHNNFILEHALSEFREVFGQKVSMAIFNGMAKNGVGHASMIFATWQTMGQNLKRWKRNDFDLIVVDEAHHSGAETYLPVLEYFTGPRLGITATPDREDDMDIRDVFGPEVISVSLEEAIARGWLPRVEYHVVTDESLDEDALQKIAAEIRGGKKRFTMAEVNRRIFIRKRDAEIARIIDGYTEKSIVFCANIQHAERMNGSLRLSKVFHSSNGHSAKDAWKRNQGALDALKNGTIRRICAINAFNEGVNVPSVGLVAFCRVTGSLTIFRQQLGRGLRPGKDKLVVLDFVGNFERIQLVLDMMNKIADLHERYTSQKERDREGYGRGSFEVSGKGFEFTFSDQVVDLMEVLGHVERDFYPTWQEASKAAQKIGLNTQSKYGAGYRADPRLPRHPSRIYKDWPGASLFFRDESRVKRYATWQEASKAARRLCIKSQKEYARRYKENPLLPSSPSSFYPDFPGLDVFLTGKARMDLYATCNEASHASRRLRFKSVEDYRKNHKRRDPRLPSTPDEKYDDFPGWTMFLWGRVPKEYYSSWRTASRAARRLKITRKGEYQYRYKVDQKLPSNPNRHYRDFPGWDVFLGKWK